MSATLTNHPDARAAVSVHPTAKPGVSGWSPLPTALRTGRRPASRVGNTSRIESQLTGTRDCAFISRSLDSVPDHSRTRAAAAAGHEWTRLNAALAFFRSRLSADLLGERPDRLRV